jgi:hypothetical protein
MPQPDKVVRLSLDSKGLPVPNEDPVPVKMNEQKVKWCASFPFTIEIDGHPSVTYGPGDSDGPHNCKTGYFSQKRRHKYSITADGKTNDPDLDIQP